jgi:hypothetical protein
MILSSKGLVSLPGFLTFINLTGQIAHVFILALHWIWPRTKPCRFINRINVTENMLGGGDTKIMKNIWIFVSLYFY